MKTSEVFTHAKKYLAKNPKEIGSYHKTQWICYAINHTGLDGALHKDIAKAKNIIAELIKPLGCFETWLSVNHNIECETRRDFNKLQVTRHAWLDHLIAHYQSMGD